MTPQDYGEWTQFFKIDCYHTIYYEGEWALGHQTRKGMNWAHYMDGQRLMANITPGLWEREGMDKLT